MKLAPDSPASYSRIWGWQIWCQLHVGGKLGWPQNKTGVVHRYQATVFHGYERSRTAQPVTAEHPTCVGFELQSIQKYKYVFLIRWYMISWNPILSVIPVYSYSSCGKFKSTRHISTYQSSWIAQFVGDLLTHLPRHKMAAISQTIFLGAFSWIKICILIKISLKFVPKGPIGNRPALV